MGVGCISVRLKGRCSDESSNGSMSAWCLHHVGPCGRDVPIDMDSDR